MALNSENQTEKEVNLFDLMKKLGELVDRVGFAFYKFLLFLKKNVILISILLIGGIALGILLDKINPKTYKHEIIVVPNFGSTTYLYDYIEGISLNNLPNEFSSITKFEIKPIVNVYDFVKERYQNLELIKQFSLSNIDFAEYKKSSGVEQYYRYHLLTIYTNDNKNSEKIISEFLALLNSDKYYSNRQKIENDNTSKLILELEKSVENVNKLLERFGNTELKAGDVNIENYSELNELVNVKKNMIDELNRQRIMLLEQEKTIFDSAKILNIQNEGISLKILLPILLLSLFFGVVLFLKFINRYKKYKENY